MNNKKLPPPPVLPPTRTISENFCLFHKGTIKGEIYTCPRCKSNYCLECAKKAMNTGESCVKCKQIVLI
ncbi:MAG: hypothetical protein ACFE85_01090 [Candidatus Hodarchaeota archaeon]